MVGTAHPTIQSRVCCRTFRRTSKGTRMRKSYLCVVVGLSLLACESLADDWPMLGRDSTRNAVSREKNPPLDWRVGVPVRPAGKRQPAQEAIVGVNIRWSAELGMNCHSAPVVQRGTVWIG